MAEEENKDKASGYLDSFNKLSTTKKAVLGAGVAAIVLATLGMFYVANQPTYKILYSNVTEKDGGDITAALDAQQIPYQVKGNGTILIPEDKVNTTRLKLASEGLPRGGSVGFELLENQKYGVSQFVEQVNYQRGLEGELAKTIQAIGAVQSARVHIAIPKQSLFVYNNDESPTASVFLHLYPGKSLNDSQIAGIIHLVASSVPKLDYKKISIVDQNGALLSEQNNGAGNASFSNKQMEYIKNVEQKLIANVDNILIPMLGKDNYKVQISASIDFSQEEKTEEVFKPNETPGSATIRSRQNNENLSLNGSGRSAGGVPGTLVSKPPEIPVATPSSEGGKITPPTNMPGNPAISASGEAGDIEVAGVKGKVTTEGGPVTSTKNSVINYEVDKTIRHVKSATGNITKLTAAVILNNTIEKDKDGKETSKERTDEEIKKIETLVKNAVGFSEQRGDALSVVSTSFAKVEPVVVPEMPIWKDPDNIDYAKELGKYVLFLIGLLFVWFKMISPILKSMQKEDKKEIGENKNNDEDGNRRIEGNDFANQDAMVQIDEYAVIMEKAKGMASNDPKAVASLVKEWMGSNEK